MSEVLEDLPEDQLAILSQLQIAKLAILRARKINDPMEDFYSIHELREFLPEPPDNN